MTSPDYLETKPTIKTKATSKDSLATCGAAAPVSSHTEGNPLFFFKANEPYGEFCQWYPATFTVTKSEMSAIVGHPIDSDDPAGWQPIYFSCAEQFVMYCKAGTFRDTETQRQILATRDPKQQKAFARPTRGFQAATWDKIKSTVVIAGNMAKFQQNPKLKAVLLGTGDCLLAEAASEDRV